MKISLILSAATNHTTNYNRLIQLAVVINQLQSKSTATWSTNTELNATLYTLHKTRKHKIRTTVAATSAFTHCILKFF